MTSYPVFPLTAAILSHILYLSSFLYFIFSFLVLGIEPRALVHERQALYQLSYIPNPASPAFLVNSALNFVMGPVNPNKYRPIDKTTRITQGNNADTLNQ